MKTLHEILKESDSKEILGTYNYKYSPRLWEIPRDCSLSDYKEAFDKSLLAFKEELKAMKPQKGNDTGILYVHKKLSDDFLVAEPETDLVFAEDLFKSDKEIAHYAFEFTPREEVLGFLVSDSPYTKRHLNDLLADCLYEMSFFGFDAEGVESVLEDLKQSAKDIEEHPERFKEIKDLYEEFGFEKPIVYEDEDLYLDRIRKEIRDYCRYCDRVELEYIRKAYETHLEGDCDGN